MSSADEPVTPAPSAEGDGSAEVKDTDIVFDCPHCGKSLAIDYRGAGLSVPCTDCGNYVEVPIPEGMELTDIDATGEDKQSMVFNLRKSLAVAESKVERLQKELSALSAKCQGMEKAREKHIQQLAAIQESTKALRRTLDDNIRALDKITDLAGKMTSTDRPS